MIKKILILLLFFSMFSCASNKDIHYFQDISSLSQEVKNYEPKIKPDDLLMIFVSAPDPEVAAPFNMGIASIQGMSTGMALDMASGQQRFQTYLVNNEGFVDFPVLGRLKFGGLTKKDVHDLLKSEISKYVSNPIVNIRIINFKVSVIGEVARPGSFNIVTERVTLLEAISQAGDLTIYGNRKNIVVIREINGVKTYTTVDITSVDFINSEFYYLNQNDVIYVYPNNTRVNASAVGPNTSVILTSVSLLLTSLALIIRL
jgi:polysaccharide biosynthesis/export protein